MPDIIYCHFFIIDNIYHLADRFSHYYSSPRHLSPWLSLSVRLGFLHIVIITLLLLFHYSLLNTLSSSPLAHCHFFFAIKKGWEQARLAQCNVTKDIRKMQGRPPKTTRGIYRENKSSECENVVTGECKKYMNGENENEMRTDQIPR